jgi:hypothetical protein
MIGPIFSIITANPLARFLAKLAGIALAVLTFGAWNRRQGAQGQKAKQAEAQAKAHQKTIEEVLRETPSDDPADAIRDRMRKRARKP